MTLVCALGRLDREQGQGSDEDEEHWQRKEARRLVRDKAELNPLTLGAHFGSVSSMLSSATGNYCHRRHVWCRMTRR